MDDDSQMLTLRGATRAAGVSRNTLRKAIREGRLKATTLNDGTWGIHRDDLEAWQEDRLPSSDTPRQESVATPIPPPELEKPNNENEALREWARQLELALKEAEGRIEVLEVEKQGVRAVMMEVRELIEVQAQRIDDLKAERAHMVNLLRQAHDQITSINNERRSLLDRLLSIIDVNIPGLSKEHDRSRQERH